MKVLIKLFFIFYPMIFVSVLQSATSPPIITKHPSSQEILPGTTTRLTVNAIGTEPIYFKWLKDNVEILNATNKVLVLQNVGYGNSGAYVAVVSNAYGIGISLPAFIVINETAFNSALENAGVWKTGGNACWFNESNLVARSGAINEGEESWIETKIIGPAILTFKWKLETDQNSDLTVQVLQNVSSDVLYDNTVNDLLTTFQAIGNYEIGDQIILNTNGLIFPIVINYFSLTYWGLNFNGNEMMDVIFYLNNGINGSPGTRIWESGWFGIQQTPKSLIVFDEDLRVRLDEPSFTWAIKFSGIEQGESVGLWIYSPPTIGSNFTDYWQRGTNGWELRMMSGYNMDFEAKVGKESYSLAHQASISGVVDWETRTIQIYPGTNIVRWTFKKRNNLQVGEDAAWLDDVRVMLPQEPIILGYSKPQFGVVGGKAQLNVEIFGAEPMWFQWQKNGQPMFNQSGFYGANSSRLTFTNLLPEHAAYYSLYVSNSFGFTNSPTIQLQVFSNELKSRLSEGVDNNEFVFITGGEGVWDLNLDVSRDGIDSVSSPLLWDTGVSWLETTINDGGGVLSFWWKLDSPDGRLMFFVDNSNLYTLETPGGWVNQFAYLESGMQHKIRWVYQQIIPGTNNVPVAFIDQIGLTYLPPIISRHPQSISAVTGDTILLSVEASGGKLSYQWRKDGTNLYDSPRISGAQTNVLIISNANISDSGYYSVVVSNPVGYIESIPAQVTIIQQIPLADALDTHNIVWSTGGDAPWRGVQDMTYDEIDAAASGNILDGQRSWLSATLYGPGTISFYAKVSSEPGFDYLEFFINNMSFLLLSGEFDWQLYTFEVPPGLNLLRWEYKKDSAFAMGLDKAWVDQFYFQPIPPTPPVIVTQPTSKSVEKAMFCKLSVETYGSWPMFFQWYRNGIPLIDNQKTAGAQSGELRIGNVDFSDTGQYYVIVSNLYGVVTSVVVSITVENKYKWDWLNPVPQGNALYDIEYFKGKYYCSGDAGVTIASDNLLNWDVNYLPLDVTIYGLYSDGEHLYAIGDNILFYTTNGTYWQFTIIPYTNNYYDIVKFDGKYIIFGGNNTIAFSTNLTDWFIVNSGYGGEIKSSAFSGTQIIAVSTTGEIYSSTNGVNWTLVQALYLPLEKVRYINGAFYAVGGGRSILKSLNGISWNYLYNSPADYLDKLSDIAFVNSNLIVYGKSATGSYFTGVSRNETNWNFNFINIFSAVNTVYNYGNGIITVGEHGKIFFTTNAIQHIEISNGTEMDIVSVARKRTNYVACLASNNAILISTNNSHWLLHPLPNNVSHLDCLLWNGRRFVGYSVYSGIFLSDNGLDWQYVTNFISDTNLPITVAGKLFYVNGEYFLFRSNSLWNSKDCTNWICHVLGNEYEINDMVYYDRYYTVGFNKTTNKGVVLQSFDGTNWAHLYVDENVFDNPDKFHSLLIIRNVIYVSGDNSRILISYDRGNSWNNVLLDTDSIEVREIKYNDGLLYAIGDGGHFYTSWDGYTWTKRQRVTYNSLNYIEFIDDKIMLYGDGGTIIRGYENVESPPRIIVQPANQKIPSGEPAIFNVIVSGALTAGYQWYKDGSPLIDSARVIGSQSPSLQIINVNTNDIGFYYVVISNSYGSITSGWARLNIYPLQAYGNNVFGQIDIPPGLTNVIKVSAGLNHSIALKDNGDVIGWGWNIYGQASSIIGSNVIDISAGDLHNIALLSDGTVIGWGNNSAGQINVPEGLSNVVAIAAGGFHSLALKQDGSVVAWGDNSAGQSSVPRDLVGVIAIAAGYDHSMALLNDGRVVIWGGNIDSARIMPSQFTNIVAISAGRNLSAGIRSDGKVVGWGAIPPVIYSLSNIVAIDLGSSVSIGIRSDGTVITWNNKTNTTLVSTLPAEYGISASAGGNHCLVLQGNGKPFVTARSISTRTTTGKPLLFSALSSGAQPMSYQWYIDYIPIPSALGPIYRIDAANLNDSGCYYCVISNVYGVSTSTPAFINVDTISPPVFVVNPTATNIIEGSTLKLFAIVRGTPPFYFQWKKDGSNIPNADRMQYIINNVSFNDRGYYAVVVSNDYGVAVSPYVLVNVLAPPKIISQPGNADISLGATRWLKVVADGTTPLFYQWRKDGTLLIEQTNSILYINADNYNVQGVYDVIVSNAYGFILSQPAIVTVGEAPIITGAPFSITKIAGEDAIFTVSATGSEPLFYQWRYYDYEIPGATNSLLRIQSVSENNEGIYGIVVYNKYGQTYVSGAFLTVLYPPSIERHPASVTLRAGETLNLSVTARGTPPLSYLWYKDGIPLLDQNASTLIITNVTLEDSGNYRVLVTSDAGFVESHVATVVVEESPYFLWVKTFGGSGNDVVHKLIEDKDGNILCVATFEGEILIDNQVIQSRGKKDVLIVKYSRTGQVLWYRQEGGIEDDIANSISTSSDNKIYVAGSFKKSIILGNIQYSQTTGSGHQLAKDDYDIFIAKYSSSGDLIWVKTAGGVGDDFARDIVCDLSGNVILIGSFEGIANFDTFEVSAIGSRDIFISKYDPSGSCLWVSGGGGFDDDPANSVTCDDSGNIYLCGAYSRGARFGKIIVKSEGGLDGFVAKYDTSGNPRWIKSIAGNGIEICRSITVDAKGENIFIAGNFGAGAVSNYAITIDGMHLPARAYLDAFILRLDSSGAALQISGLPFGETWQSSGIIDSQLYPSSISLNRNAELIISGYLEGQNNSGFIIQFSKSGVSLYSNSIPNAIILSAIPSFDGGIVIAGSYKVDAWFGSIHVISSGGHDGFIGKIYKPAGGPPLIVNQPISRAATIGSMVRFEVGANGTYPLHYQWYKDNIPIANATYPFYEVFELNAEDIGSYFVIVSNSLGSVPSQLAQLQIALPPLITNDLQDATGSVGGQVSLNVGVMGTQPLSFTWYFNNKLFARTAEPYILFTELGKENDGEYFVVITNEIGSVTSRTSRLTVAETPTIVVQPSDQQTMLGLSAKFNVGAKGSTPLFYQWYFNDNALIGKTNSDLMLYRVTPVMDGNYYVVVSNIFGAVTSKTVKLTVAVPPQILIQPASRSVQLGDSVTFNVVPVDPAGVNYQWFKNEKAIPGATNSYLGIWNIKLSDAGAYHVVLHNYIGGTRSAFAYLRINIPDIPLNDNFENRGVIYSVSGYGKANSTDATRQPGEPLPGGRRLTNSMWISWYAPVSGIASISLEGSAFDTVLAVYTGTELTNLSAVAFNDDAQIGEKYSRVQFNAVADTEYIIMVNGIGGGGEIIMEWNIESTIARLPELVTDLMDTNVLEGASVTFAVTTSTGRGIVNWYFNGNLIASNVPGLVIENVTAEKVGIYQAEIIDGSRIIYSRAIKLNMIVPSVGVDVKISTIDKLAYLIEMIFGSEENTLLQHSSRRLIRTQGPARGFTGSQVFNTYGSATDPGEPLHCGIVGGSSEWFVYQAPTNGLLVIDTFGSTYDTVLAVYDVPGNLPPSDYTDLRSITCNNDASPSTQQSRVTFYATAETIYYIAIDGVGGARGIAKLNYSLIVPPSIVNQPTNQTVTAGQNVSFAVTASGTNLNYIWRFNSINMTGKTNSVLTLTNVQTNNAGYYSVIISNDAGVVVSSNALLTVNYSPVIISNPSSLVVLKGGTANLIASAMGTAPLFYQWLFERTPIANQTNASLTLYNVQLNSSGEYLLVVSNSLGVSTSAPAYLAVIEPGAQALTLNEDSPHLITLGPASTNGIVLGYLITIPPTNGVLSGIGNIRTYTPVTNYFGTDTFAFAMSDGTQTSMPAVVSLTIMPVNDPPAINPFTNVVEYANSPISFTVLAVDVDSTSLSYSLASGAPAGASINPLTGLFYWVPTTNNIGTNQITIVVNDNGTPNLMASRTVSVNVLPLNPVQILHSELLTNGFVKFRVQGRIARTNIIETTVLFNKWNYEFSIIPLSEVFEITVDPASQSRKFYRIKIEQ